MEGLDDIKDLMKSLSLSDTEKKDQINIFILYSHLKWMEEHIKWLSKKIDQMEEKIEELRLSKFSKEDAGRKEKTDKVLYASVINTTKRALIFDSLLKNPKVEGRKIAEYVNSDPNYISHILKQWVEMGLVNSPCRGTFKLSVDEKTRRYIKGLVKDILG